MSVSGGPGSAPKRGLAAGYGLFLIGLLAVLPGALRGLRASDWPGLLLIAFALAFAGSVLWAALRRPQLGARRWLWAVAAIPGALALALAIPPLLHDLSRGVLAGGDPAAAALIVGAAVAVVSALAGLLRPGPAPAVAPAFLTGGPQRRVAASLAVILFAGLAGMSTFVRDTGSSNSGPPRSSGFSNPLGAPPTPNAKETQLASGTIQLPPGNPHLLIAKGHLDAGGSSDETGGAALIYASAGGLHLSSAAGQSDVAAGGAAFAPAGPRHLAASAAGERLEAVFPEPAPAGLQVQFDSGPLPPLPPGTYQYVLTLTSVPAHGFGPRVRSTGIQAVFALTGSVHVESGTGNKDLSPGQGFSVLGNTPIAISAPSGEATYLTVYVVAAGDPLTRPGV